MYDKIWDLIRDEAEAIEGYFKVLEECREKPECAALAAVISDIIADEQDHADALNYVYLQMGGIRAATDTITVAKREVSKIRAAKIYKDSLAKEE